MALPKRKNNIDVYGSKETYQGQQLMNRRQELLDQITKSDSFLPDSILHDDLDLGMLSFVKENFVVVSDGVQIPIIPKILTIQRWGEFTNNWEFSDEDGNVKLPFIAIIRRPDVQPGTHPVGQNTIPNRKTFYYASVPTWNGTQMGADVYKIPQPVAIDISYEVTIVCTKFRDLNRFNKIIHQKFSSRQAYTIIKGHYIPILLDTIEDNSPMETLDGRRFYIQNYKFTMLGFLVDSDEFEVKPAISRMFLSYEFIKDTNFTKKFISKVIDITVVTFIANGTQTIYSVGESIAILFHVSINGVLQEQNINFYHIPGTSKITFTSPPYPNSVIVIKYYRGKKSVLIDNYGKPIYVSTEVFTYDGSTLTFEVVNAINDIVTLDVNGLVEEENVGYTISGVRTFTLLAPPVVGSRVSVTYLY